MLSKQPKGLLRRFGPGIMKDMPNLYLRNFLSTINGSICSVTFELNLAPTCLHIKKKSLGCSAQSVITDRSMLKGSPRDEAAGATGPTFSLSVSAWREADFPTPL